MLALEGVLGREQSLNREVIGSNCTSVSEVVLLLANFPVIILVLTGSVSK